jgi:hypothetical protein
MPVSLAGSGEDDHCLGVRSGRPWPLAMVGALGGEVAHLALDRAGKGMQPPSRKSFGQDLGDRQPAGGGDLVRVVRMHAPWFRSPSQASSVTCNCGRPASRDRYGRLILGMLGSATFSVIGSLHPEGAKRRLRRVARSSRPRCAWLAVLACLADRSLDGGDDSAASALKSQGAHDLGEDLVLGAKQSV